MTYTVEVYLSHNKKYAFSIGDYNIVVHIDNPPGSTSPDATHHIVKNVPHDNDENIPDVTTDSNNSTFYEFKVVDPLIVFAEEKPSENTEADFPTETPD